MSLRRYYRVLGLPDGADQDSIRKAYRKQAMRFHPDRNPSKSAEKQFIVITEAYEILTGKRPAPAPRRTATTSQNPNVSKKAAERRATKARKSDEERVKEAQERYREQQLREKLEDEAYFRKLTTGVKWKTVKVCAVVGIILSILFIADRFLPHHYETDRVTHYSLNQAFSSNGSPLSIVKTKKDNYYWVSRMTYTLYGRAPSISVESSWIFHEPIRLISHGKVENTYFNVHYTFYSNFFLILAIMLTPTFTIFYKRRTPTFTILYHTSYFGIGALILYFVFTHDRWAHLLTLGFF